MHRIDTAERRRRLAVRHRIAPAFATDDLIAATRSIVAVHASDPASVYLQLLARASGFERAHLEDALYERRTLVKVLGMRRTMFVVPIDTAAIMNAACTRSIGVTERKRTLQLLRDAGIASDPEPWLAAAERETVAALASMGEATAADLTRVVPGLREQIEFGAGKKWQGRVGVSTRLLFLLAAEARIIRARPRGSWLSSLYRWAPMDRWIEGGLPELPTDEARVELARRWLAAFGPGTLQDLRWWAGWTVAATRQALAGAEAVAVELEEGTGFVLPGDLETTTQPDPWVALLPGLDATTMGWANRDWYLGGHGEVLFDTNGNAGPMVWVDGRIVGGWGQRPDGSVAYRLLEDVGSDTTIAIIDRAAAVETWLEGTRVIPRFPSPLGRELSA